MTTGVGAVPITFAALQGAKQPAAFLDQCFAYASAKVVQPKDFGAVGDNVTNDTSAVSAMTAATGSWRFTAATGYNVTSFVITANSSGKGDRRSAPVTIASTGGITISGSAVTLTDLYVNGPSSAIILQPSAASTDVALRNLDLVTSSAASPNGYCVEINQAGCSRWSLQGSYLSAYQYGFLVNSAAGGSKGFIALGNFITSFQADCVNFNSPSTSVEDAVVVGNVTNITNGTGTQAGFSVCFAHVNGGYAVGNISQRSWLEAHHVEDGSKNLGFVGNLSKACQNHGANFLVDGANFAQAKPFPVIGNTYEAPAVTGASLAGIRVAWTGSGSIDGMSIIGNVVRNFDIGLYLGSIVRAHADGNVIDNCTTAMQVDTNAIVTGTNRVIGSCLRLLFCGSTTANDVRVGKFVCDTKPTAVIVKAAPGTTRPGCSVEGFKWPQPNTALVNGTNQVQLVATPTRMIGRLKVIAFNQASNADMVWYVTDITYDGTTITLSNTLVESSGNLGVIAAPAITVSGGAIRVGLSSVGAMTALVGVEFDGVYML